ncbi:MAG: hypothetical protein IM586_15755 [Pseudanabaena sp. M172S2SP2A07QC]|nr:hypothetical protein [Pseudanabaena sp. M172S2SP2A07QC]MCA6510273.1 hypothetical protein [Pseudanabaena sp. M109S1SP2A07QC]MCA6546677.1 hypothetical protein [Pseudanabaena sp. M152S2SP2A07QC]
MNKQQFIQSIKADNPEWDAQQILEYANTPFLHPNPVPQPTVPKQVSFTAVAQNIPATDRVVIQNELSGTYESLLKNIDKGQLNDVAGDIENLIASNRLSITAIQVIQAAIAEVSQGQPDPNWQATIYSNRCQDLGFSNLILTDLE